MGITNFNGTATNINETITNPFTGEELLVNGLYYINDTLLDGGSTPGNILIASSNNQYISIQDSLGTLLFQNFDTVLLGGGDDILNLASLTHVLGDMVINAGTGHNIVWANAGNDTITALGGNDILNGGAGNDTINAGAGDDVLTGAQGDDTIDGGDGYDEAHYVGDFENYSITFIGGVYTVVDLYGTDGTDTLMNVENFIFADGVYANNVFRGANGDDIFFATAAVEHHDGGAGFDLVDFSASLAGVNIDFVLGTSTGGSAEGDTYSSIEHVVGSAHDDIIFSDDSAQTIEGGDGNDFILGNGGDDTLYGGAGEDAIGGGTGDDIIHLGDGNDLSAGQDGNDTIYGDAGEDEIYGQQGNDTIYGGDDTDYIDGGDDDDILYGEDGIDLITGGNGNDMIYGGLGDDYLHGGEGNDTINGGEGFDRAFYFSSFWNFVINPFNSGSITLTDVVGTTGTDTLIDVEVLHFIDGYFMNNTFFDLNGNRTFYATLSAEHFQGGAGHDTLDYSGSSSFVVVDLGAGVGVNGFASGDTFVSIEEVIGSNSDDIIFGGKANEILHGGFGADILFGDAGDDILYGGAGNDTLKGGDGFDKIYGGQGNDNIFGGDDKSTDILYGDDGNDYLNGGAGNDQLYGGTGADTLIGGAGDDILNGGQDSDILFGGAGSDTYVFGPESIFGIDTVRGFNLSQFDMLDISDMLVGYDPLTSLLSDFVQITDNGTDSFLSVNSSGTGALGQYVQIAILSNVTGLTDENALEASGHLITT
ncbi:MAG: type I secretion C-terminal target domain-containing protein [Alphaproteobacteria bacterium]|nr:type I secretion C-terminal target domain-containing protein [Alphaproteobacteria bacterium]